MSLKAKIEAVIYASEEPVTLTQLVGLLGQEGQAEIDALTSRQASLNLEAADDIPLSESGEPDALNAEVLGEETAEETAADPSNDSAEPAATPPPAEAARSETEPSGTADNTPALDDKKQTRERERVLREHFRSILDALVKDYAQGDRGLEIREVAGGFRLATKPEYHDAVRGFVKSLKPALKLSLQALETLAVVAYKQPVTAPEISEIRGVDSGGVLGGLMARKLITTAGRKQVIGRPILYKTTKDFLVRFGLKDIQELPSIEEFEKMAGELADLDPVQEEIPMEEPRNPESDDRAQLDDISVDEVNAAPAAEGVLHETPEELLGDKATKPDGAMQEHANPHDVEPNANVHEAQAYGTP